MTALVNAATTALVQSLWQEAVVGVIAWAVLGLSASRSARSRYAIGCVGLAFMASLPILTAMSVYSSSAATVFPANAISNALTSVGSADRWSAFQPAPFISHKATWSAVVEPWILPIWFLGVVACSIRLCLAATHVRALTSNGTQADEALMRLVSTVAGRLQLQRTVRVLVSSIDHAPAAIGWIQPMILIPGAALMNLTPGQVEALIAHELAHVRRYDYLVNGLQMVIETLLFYHPAAWWLSRRIRMEREMCCDDVVVAACGDPVGYAHALASVARVQIARPALGSSGTPLLGRIQRLLTRPVDRSPSTALWTIAAAMVLIAVLSGVRTRAEQAVRQPVGAITGTVIDAVTGSPIRGAMVDLMPGGRQLTDARGRFEFRTVSVGTHIVRVQTRGYVSTYFGQRPNQDVSVADQAAVPIAVGARETVAGITVPVTPEASIRGRVLDAGGHPIADAQVEVLRKNASGRLTPVEFGESSGASAEFDVHGLASGQYLVRAYLSELTHVDGDAGRAYAPTFYPNVISPEEAPVLTVRTGEHLDHIDIALAASPTHTVSGTISPSGVLVRDVIVELSPLSGGAEPHPQSAVTPDGHFQLTDVLEGRYVLRIATGHDEGPWIGTARLVDIRHDVADLSIASAPPIHLTGEIVSDRGRPLGFDPRYLEITLEYAVDGVTSELGRFSGVHADGTFAIDAPPGVANVHVGTRAILRGTPTPTRMLIGGRDVTDQPIRIEPAIGKLTLTFSDQTSGLTGAVTDGAGHAAPYALVLLFPEDSTRWANAGQIYTAFAQRDGVYQVAGIRGGQYRAVALKMLPLDAWTDPRVLARLRPLATTLTLADDQQETLPLKVVSFEQASETDRLPEFEVASIKQNTSGEQPANNWRATQGRTDFHNSQIIQLLRQAYGDFSLRVDGAPQWTRSDRYDVVVQFPVGTPSATTQLMLRRLLIERFSLLAHVENQDTATFDLVPARADRRPGPKLEAAIPECAPMPGVPTPAQCRQGGGGSALHFDYTTMPNLARALSNMAVVGRPVTDKTGLPGAFKIDLTFAPAAQVLGAAAPANSAAPDLPSIFTALQEQLGLKLADSRGLVPILIVERIERPRPD